MQKMFLLWKRGKDVKSDPATFSGLFEELENRSDRLEV
jgi:hypothetical protein